METIQNPLPGVVYQSEDKAAQYVASGAWVDMAVGDALRATARRVPDKAAFISDERTMSFRELDEATERLGAALLQIGLATGDRAIFQLGTTLETVVAVLACYKAGIVPVCAIPQYREVEIGSLAASSQAKAHFVQADFSKFDLVGFAREMATAQPSMAHTVVVRGKAPQGMHGLDELMAGISLTQARERMAQVRISPRDVLSFQLSGGSTGLPKIIPRFHAEYLGHSKAWARRYGIDEQARIIWSLPIMHNAGQLYALIPPVLMGLTAVLMPKVDIRRMLELIETHRVTHGLSIGPIAPQLIAYQQLADHDLSSLRLFATMSRADKLQAHLGVPCSNLYGITEGLLMGAGAQEAEFARHFTQGASGCPDDEIRVLAPDSEQVVALGTMGELCFCGPSSLLAYYGDEAASSKALTSDGFVRTGDMVTEHRVEGGACYAFEGRLRDNINRGGEKIGCEEVEGYISQHPAVADAKLVAMPDDFYGEKACVYLILRPGQVVPDLAGLASFLTSQGLAKFKCPERIELVQEFPITRVGKVDKVELRRRIAEQLQREQARQAEAQT